MLAFKVAEAEDPSTAKERREEKEDGQKRQG